MSIYSGTPVSSSLSKNAVSYGTHALLHMLNLKIWATKCACISQILNRLIQTTDLKIQPVQSLGCISRTGEFFLFLFILFIFFGCTFDLVSQKSIIYTCVTHMFTLLWNAYRYLSPTPTTPTNSSIAQEMRFQHAASTSKKTSTVLCASAAHIGHN